MHYLTRDKSFYKDYFSLLLYIAFQNLVAYSVSLADNIMLSGYSQAAFNGASLANQFQFLLQMVASSVGEGVVVLSSQYWGARRREPIYSIISAGCFTALIVGFIFWLGAAIAPEWLLHLLSDSELSVPQGVAYMRIIKYTYPIFCLTTVLVASMRSVESARIGFYINIVSLCVNLVLNYCLIGGHLGFDGIGVRGAAIATLISRSTELVIIVLYVLRMDKKLELTFKKLCTYSKTLWHDYYKYALPIIGSGASWGIAMFIQTSIIGHMSDDVISANSVALTLFSVISVFAYGGGNASGVLTGKVVGSGNLEKLKEYVRTMQLLFVVSGLITGAAIFLCKNPVIAMHKLKTDAAVKYAKQFITVLSITSIGSAYQAPCLTGIVRGGGHTKFVLYNDLIFQWCIVLTFSLLAAYVWKLQPVWVFFMLKSDQLLKCVVAVFEVNSYRWVHSLTRKTDT